jgi:methylated-DNA-[protein]-cysteine S-methyltransferase
VPVELFSTALGAIALATDGHEVTGLCFAEDGCAPPPATPLAIALAEFLAGERDALPSAPLRLQGTPFQQRVWGGLVHVPFGETVTYGELAGRIGLDPAKSARAVGSACAANEISLLIPCHRVVAASGSLTGYRWGLDRKRALRELEHRAVHGSLFAATG